MLGICELPRRGDVGEAACDEQEDGGHEHHRHRRVGALRQIQTEREQPSAMPASEYALSPSFLPNDAVDASHSPITCTASASVTRQRDHEECFHTRA